MQEEKLWVHVDAAYAGAAWALEELICVGPQELESNSCKRFLYRATARVIYRNGSMT